MSAKTKTVEKNGNSKITCTKSVLSRAFTANSEWPDKVNYVTFLKGKEKEFICVAG